jgi:hypothetical protein
LGCRQKCAYYLQFHAGITLKQELKKWDFLEKIFVNNMKEKTAGTEIKQS